MRKNFPKNLPPDFAKNAVGVCGETGALWLEDLPRIIAEISERWSLEVEPPFPNLSYNFVAPCRRADGEKMVLKIGLPEQTPGIFNEAEFLKTAGGTGAVRLLDFDESRRAMLLEHLEPGENLKQVCGGNETRAAEIAVRVMRRLLREAPADSKFPGLDDWFGGFFRKAAATDFPAAFQNKAREFYETLTCGAKTEFLIHGDLHHENILSARRESFLAIDPKGVVGGVGYEIAVFLNNHLRWVSADAGARVKLDCAVREFSEAFEIAPLDLKRWAFAQSVLSAWWTFEENSEDWRQELALAEFWEV